MTFPSIPFGCLKLNVFFYTILHSPPPPHLSDFLHCVSIIPTPPKKHTHPMETTHIIIAVRCTCIQVTTNVFQGPKGIQHAKEMQPCLVSYRNLILKTNESVQMYWFSTIIHEIELSWNYSWTKSLFNVLLQILPHLSIRTRHVYLTCKRHDLYLYVYMKFSEKST